MPRRSRLGLLAPACQGRRLLGRGTTDDSADCYPCGSETSTQPLVPRPRRPRSAAIEVERRRAKFGIRMASEVRFAEKKQARDAAGPGELVPRRFADDVQAEFADNAIAEPAHAIEIAQRLGATAFRIHQPFGARRHALTPVKGRKMIGLGEVELRSCASESREAATECSLGRKPQESGTSKFKAPKGRHGLRALFGL